MSLIDVPREQSFHFCPHLLNRDLESAHSLRCTSSKLRNFFEGVSGFQSRGDDRLKTRHQFLCRSCGFEAKLLNALHQFFGYVLGCYELLSPLKHPALCVGKLVRGGYDGRDGEFLRLPSRIGLNAYTGRGNSST